MLTFPTVMFAHSMSMVLVYIHNQFKKVKKIFRRALDERGQFGGDLSAFRRRHQTLSRAVSKVDGFMMLSNVAGFVCHVCNIIILLFIASSSTPRLGKTSYLSRLMCFGCRQISMVCCFQPASALSITWYACICTVGY